MWKGFLKALYYSLLISAIFFVGMCSIVSFNMPSCGENSEAVSYARSLSKERLSKLYTDMELYSKVPDQPIDGYHAYQENAFVPKEFEDLKVAKIRPREGNIMIEGCFDHYVYLRFEGVGYSKDDNDKNQIILSWGEHPLDAGSEILWTEK